MNNTLELIGKTGLVPVIKIDDAVKAVPLARALAAGGLPCAEITFRTDAAEEAIRRIHAELPEMLLGAGTVINTALAKKAIDAGASFIVSPGFNPAVVDYCQERGVTVIPGVNNPSGIEAALERNLAALKFFPAEASGGVAMLEALGGPFPQVSFMPTGGVDSSNLRDYLLRPNVLAVGGSWMVKADLIAAENWEAITALCREAATALHGFSIAHLGINSPDAQAAGATAALFSLFFGPLKDGASSIFCGTPIEVMKTRFRGQMGHIGISCLSIERALHYLSFHGFKPVLETAKYEKEKLVVVYLEPEVGDFALHLVRAKN